MCTRSALRGQHHPQGGVDVPPLDKEAVFMIPHKGKEVWTSLRSSEAHSRTAVVRHVKGSAGVPTDTFQLIITFNGSHICGGRRLIGGGGSLRKMSTLLKTLPFLLFLFISHFFPHS